MKPKINIIAALSVNNIIGVNNQLPWDLPAEWDYFRKVTKGAPFIMGRKSFDNPDALLSEEHNYILTRQQHLNLPENATLVHSLEAAIVKCKDYPEVFVLGGASVFSEALKLADSLYLSIIHTVVEGDAFFPEIDWFKWDLQKGQRFMRDAANDYSFSMNVYCKKKA